MGDLEQKQLLILWVSLPLILGFTLMGGYRQILGLGCQDFGDNFAARQQAVIGSNPDVGCAMAAVRELWLAPFYCLPCSM